MVGIAYGWKLSCSHVTDWDASLDRRCDVVIIQKGNNVLLEKL